MYYIIRHAISRLTIPSIPWGNSKTMPLWRTHLAWPAEMNWSMMHWAVLWKSPNWASQHTKALGLAIAKPSSKPNKNQHVSEYFGHKKILYKGFWVWSMQGDVLGENSLFCTGCSFLEVILSETGNTLDDFNFCTLWLITRCKLSTGGSLTQNSIFRQGAVAHCIESLVLPQVVHWNAEALINFLIMQDVVTVTAKMRSQIQEPLNRATTTTKR